MISSSNRISTLRATSLVLFFFLLAAPLLAEDVMEVPGGRDSIGRLFGHVDLTSEGFASSLNRVLLDTIDESHDGSRVLNRVRLDHFLDTVVELQSRFPAEIVFSGKPAVEGNFRTLAEFLGYRVELLGRGVSLQPRPGDRWVQRREVARALGWDLLGIARELNRGGQQILSVDVDVATPLLPFKRWSSISDKEVDGTNALRSMIDDQRLGLLVAGLEQVSAETAESLDDGEFLRGTYQQGAVPFYRYAAALEIRGGRLQFPGGESAQPVWKNLLGAKTDEPLEYLARLLEESPPRAVHLWHALYFSPPPVTHYFLNPNAEDRRGRDTFLKALHDQVVEIDDQAALTSARGNGQGVPALLRALSLNEAGDAIDLPGGLGLWLAAVRGEPAPDSVAELARLAVRAQKKEIDDREFFLRMLRVNVESPIVKQSALPRLIRAAGLVGDRREWLTPENVILVTRAVETYPMALRTLERMKLADPANVRDYLRAVAQLDAIQNTPAKYLGISNFQGGIELLRILGDGERLDPEVARALFREWTTLHLDYTDPGALAPYQLGWLEKLLAELPDVDSGEPGRGPLERNLLASLTGRKDPLRLRWRGLDYTAHRSRDVATRLADHVRRQDIASVDELVELHRGFVRLKERSYAADLEQVHEISQALTRSVNDLPNIEAAKGSPTFRDWIEPVDRPRVLGILRRFESQKNGSKLPKMAPLAHRAEMMMAREIRPLLIAPSYLECMGHLKSLLFLETGLIQRHTMLDEIASTRHIPLDTPWVRTKVVPGGRSPVGTRVVGHLGGVPESLVQYHVSQSDDLRLLEHQKIFFTDWLTTPWSTITPDDAKLAEALIRAGDALLHETSPEAAEFINRRIPIRRHELHDAGEAATVSTSESFSLGLALMNGDAYGPARPELLEPALRRELTELTHGENPQKLLHHVGGATLELNGHGRRWVGTWPSYEAVQNEAGPQPIIERELADLRLAVVAYLGRRGFPGEVGADLMLMILEEMPQELRIETDRDWVGFVRWVHRMNDDYFDRRMRRCLARGLYRLQDS